MAFVSKDLFSAMLLLAPLALGFSFEKLPEQTVKGAGIPFSPRPTEAPSRELVRAKLGKRAATNVCSEWTIPGGGGQPQCGSSQTCQFTTAGDYFFEGCGEDGVVYDWITECYNYPQSGTAPLSELYCPKSAPYCGYMGFVFVSGLTAYNFGCSTTAYGIAVQLISSDLLFSTGTDFDTTDSTTATRSVSIFVSSTPSASETDIPRSTTLTRTSTRAAASSTTTTNPTIGSHDVKVAIGLVVGVVVGGIAFIGILLGLLIFLCCRRRKQKRFPAIQQQPAATSNNNQGIAEIGGTGIKPFVGVYAPTAQEKPGVVVGATEIYGNAQPGNQNYDINGQGTGQVPPPTYQQGISPIQSPQRHYNELATSQSGPDRPVSPMGPSPSPTPVSEMHGSPHSRPGELLGDNRQSSPVSQQIYQQYQPPPVEMAGEDRHASPSPHAQGAWQAPSGVQEMGVSPSQSAGPVSGTGLAAETSATVGSRVARRPVGAPASQAVDISGAPLNETWNGRHEME